MDPIGIEARSYSSFQSVNEILMLELLPMGEATTEKGNPFQKFLASNTATDGTASLNKKQ